VQTESHTSSPGFDALDRRLLSALALDGRASFSRVAAVLGVSDQTVARRYARLRSEQRIRVTGRTDPARLGEVSWFVRIHCVPSVALTLGRTLARRPDTTWVKLASGGTEIVCVVRAVTSQDSESLLLEKLPKTPNVVNVSANCLLHVFFGGPESVINMLTPDQADRLRPPAPQPGPIVALDQADRRMLGLLQTDGRATVTDLAWLRDRGLDTAVQARAAAGRAVLGICGGLQMLCAFVVLRDGVDGDARKAAELQEFVKRQLAPYKYPRDVRFVEALPRNSSGKLQHFKLRQIVEGVAR